ncbi:hypothetical protein SETIT_3G043200v2 [Setaria italica]|uniref:1-phosphatidylinositol 4-kinase n=1 Tax=Setaria italica TaxID=4555 RepID=A0A368QB77_SETIT|nr:hypothetical protein SETIT_3G043200v2 [Setaria italica]
MDLDRGDNAHTVKRWLQLELNVPTGETSLMFGHRVLENDLSSIRSDSPVLLTRNSINRSCSTLCLCPISKDFEQKDCSGLVEMLGCSSSCDRVKRLVEDVVTAIRSRVDPVPISSGLGGSYYFRNVIGDRVAIVKPTDEEPFAPNNPKGFVGRALGQLGLKKSVRVGETGFREVAAYLLDHDNFANVPATALVKITHSIFNINCPLFPIDHGMCLPENLEDPYFEWIHWAQASIPFSEEELEYIRNLDPGKDVMMLRRELPMIREMLTREFRGMEEEPSQLEVVCVEVRKRVAEWEPFSATAEQEATILGYSTGNA